MLWRYAQHMLHSYGELWLARGDHDRAIALAEECLDLAERSDSPKNVVKARRLRGQALRSKGRIDEATLEFEQAASIARAIGNAGQLWRSCAALGDLQRARGRDDDARATFTEALSVIDRIAEGLTDQNLRDTFLSSVPVGAIREGVAS